MNRKLSWQIAKIVKTDDPFVALQHLPGSEGIEIILKKGRAAGVTAEHMEATRHAVEAFDRMVQTHCGDRATFEAMGSDLSSGEEGRQQQEAIRKQFFLSASAIWGAQTRVNFKLRVIAPTVAGSSDEIDMASVGGLIDFRRLRENRSWVIAEQRAAHDDGTPMELTPIEPIDPRAAGEFVPLLREFCSDPLPAFNITRNRNFACAELPPAQTGNAGLLSYMFGWLDLRLPHSRTARDQTYSHACASSTPAELFLFDVYIHESMAFAHPPRPMLSGVLTPHFGGDEHERNRLPLHEPLIHLGSPAPAPITPEVPRYAELLKTVFDRTGWAPAEFVGYRIRLPYPPVPASLVMRYELPRSDTST